MTTSKFRALCKKILIPEIESALRRHAASRQLIVDLTTVLERHFAGLAKATDDEVAKMNVKLDEMLARLRK
jgi:hypothetical protein